MMKAVVSNIMGLCFYEKYSKKLTPVVNYYNYDALFIYRLVDIVLFQIESQSLINKIK